MPDSDLDAVLTKIGECLLREDQSPFLHDENSLLCVTGFSSTSDPHQVALNRHVLDRLSKDLNEDPVGGEHASTDLVAFSGYRSERLNSRALEIAGIGPAPFDLARGDIDRDEEGIPTGKLTDVYGIDIGTEPPLSQKVMKAAKLATLEALTSCGITGAFVAGGDPIHLEVWAEIADDWNLSILVNQALWADDFRGLRDEDSRQLVSKLDDSRARFNGYTTSGSPGELLAKDFCSGTRASSRSSCHPITPTS